MRSCFRRDTGLEIARELPGREEPVRCRQAVNRGGGEGTPTAERGECRSGPWDETRQLPTTGAKEP